MVPHCLEQAIQRDCPMNETIFVLSQLNMKELIGTNSGKQIFMNSNRAYKRMEKTIPLLCNQFRHKGDSSPLRMVHFESQFSHSSLNSSWSIFFHTKAWLPNIILAPISPKPYRRKAIFQHLLFCIIKRMGYVPFPVSLR